MSLAQSELKQIAYLARLSLDAVAGQNNTDDFNKILDLVEQLNNLDTDNIEPMAHPLDRCQRLREDEVSETDQSVIFQAIAPQVGKQHYLLPKVLE